MSTSVKLLEAHDDYAAGEIIDVSKGQAADLVKEGKATKVLYEEGHIAEVTKTEKVWKKGPPEQPVKKKKKGLAKVFGSRKGSNQDKE